MGSENTGTRDCFVAKGIKWHRGMWGDDKPGGVGVITVWAATDDPADTEMPWDREAKRCPRMVMGMREGDGDWPNEPEGRKLIGRVRRAWDANRPCEVILRDGDRKLDKARLARSDPNYFAVRITYVGSVETGDLGTILGEFMTQAEYLA